MIELKDQRNLEPQLFKAQSLQVHYLLREETVAISASLRTGIGTLKRFGGEIKY